MIKEPRRSIITIAVTIEEKSLIEAHARASELTVSSYARLILLDAHPITLELKKQATTGR